MFKRNNRDKGFEKKKKDKNIFLQFHSCKIATELTLEITCTVRTTFKSILELYSLAKQNKQKKTLWVEIFYKNNFQK